MSKRNVEEDVLKKRFVMEEYTEFLRRNLGEHRNITRVVFKVVGKIYKAIQKGATEKQIDRYIDALKKRKYN